MKKAVVFSMLFLMSAASSFASNCDLDAPYQGVWSKSSTEKIIKDIAKRNWRVHVDGDTPVVRFSFRNGSQLDALKALARAAAEQHDVYLSYDIDRSNCELSVSVKERSDISSYFELVSIDKVSFKMHRGQRFSEALKNWASISGWTVQWNATSDWTIAGGFDTYENDFLKAVQKLSEWIKDDRNATIQFQIYAGNRVLVVTDK